MDMNPFLKFSIIILLSFSIISHASQILSTDSRWIVSTSGDRFKLRCVNWSGHLHVMIPEGLHEQPLEKIAKMISTMGFNCVRLSWAINMYTKYSSLKVEQALKFFNLTSATDGIRKNNPKFLSMSFGDVQEAVIDELGANNVVVILDNHVSEPFWCCDWNDGNGFFGDKFFDPGEWLQGLSIVSAKYKNNPIVVGMSLRNELRGPRQNLPEWYRYMQQGAEAVNKQNPNLLVIVSGLTYDSELKFLKQQPFNVTFKNKLVFEAHLYPFGMSIDMWKHQTNIYCHSMSDSFWSNAGFLLEDPTQAFPLFLSEFGVDLRGGDEMGNLYFSCLLAYMAEWDMDWAVWTLQGSYMLRQNAKDVEEVYGLLSKDWGSVRNTSALQRLQLIQHTMLDSKRKVPSYYILYHPQSGSCIHMNNKNKIYNGDCQRWKRWSYDRDYRIRLNGGKNCLIATGDGMPVTISGNCGGNQSTWRKLSQSSFHLATTDKSGKLLCLDWDTRSSAIITKKCLCLDGYGRDVVPCEQNPQRQWFTLVPANIK